MAKETYYVLAWGHGQGCDYTIGCNMDITEVKAESAEEVLQWVRERYTPDEPEYFKADHLEYYPERVAIAKAAADFNIIGYLQTFIDANNKAAVDRKEAKERKEYERLKQKFGE